MTLLAPDQLERMVATALAQPQFAKPLMPKRWVYGGLGLALAACFAAFLVMPVATVTGTDEITTIVADMSDMTTYDLIGQSL